MYWTIDRVDQSVPTSSERTSAALAHVSGIFFPIIGPLVAFVIGNKSTYVRYHALHAFIGLLLLNLFLFTAGAISLFFSLLNLYRQYQENFQNFEWWPFILKSVLTWVIVALIGLVNTVVNIVQAIRAYNGSWPGKGLTTALVNRFVKRPAIAPSTVS